MNLRLMFSLLLFVFSGSVSYGLSCKPFLGKSYFWEAIIHTDAVMCLYRECNNVGCAYSADYVDGKYQPDFGNWKLTPRNQYACLSSQDGISLDCQFIAKHLKHS